jgi:predicted nucleotidyltransferase
VEKISAALVGYFKLPVSSEEANKIIAEQSNILSSFDVVNRSSVDKIPASLKKLLDALIVKIREDYKDDVAAVYLVGSLGRGEYEEGYSDINVYVIYNIDEPSPQVLKENSWVSLRVFTKAEFLSEQSKKYRVIAKADGVLLYGNDLVKDEKLPKAGLFLALILNDDILETLDEAKRWMEGNPTASPMQISRKSRRLAKRLIDFVYGVVMGNKPHYTASRKERVEKILEAYPENKDVIETLMGISRHGVGELESFKNTIEGFRPRAEENLKKMREVEAALKKD